MKIFKEIQEKNYNINIYDYIKIQFLDLQITMWIIAFIIIPGWKAWIALAIAVLNALYLMAIKTKNNK